MSSKDAGKGSAPIAFRRGALLGMLTCALLRGVLLLWLGVRDPGEGILLVLGAGAFVPRLIGGFEPFVQVLSIAPDLLMLFRLTDFVTSALRRDSSLTLPRTGGRRAWAGEKCLRLVVHVILYEALSTSVVLVAATLLSGEGQTIPDALTASALWCALLDSALLLALLLWANLLALGRDAIVAFAVASGTHVAALLALAAVPSGDARTLAHWLPSARGVPAWHLILCEQCGNTSGVAASMEPAVSATLLFALSAILALAIISSVQRADII